MANKAKKSHKIIYGLTTLLVVTVIVVLWLTNVIPYFHKAAVVRAPGKPITSLSTTSTSSNSKIAAKTPAQNSSIQQGTATDENGKVLSSNVPTNPSDWSTSSSGLITVKLPEANSTFMSGNTVTGSASTGPVKYSLIDNQVGVVSQGVISVVNGNFTATINFQHQASSGRLDIYNTEANGRQINEVEIPINF